MVVLEFFVLFLYVCVVALTSVTLLLVQANQKLTVAYRDSVEKHQSELHNEVLESEEEVPESEEEQFTMTENPMLRHRIPEAKVDEVD